MTKIQNPKNESFRIWKFRISNLFRIWSLGFRIFKREAGFTLLEMLISMSIFSVVVMVAAGIMISVQRAREKTGSVLLMQDNIRYTLELISREMRTGARYAKTFKGQACSGVGGFGQWVPGSEISFQHYNQGFPQDRIYFLMDADGDGDPDTIMRVKQDTINPSDCSDESVVVPFTDTENVVVEDLRFDLGGDDPGPSDGQPWVRIVMRVRSKNVRPSLQSTLEMQTMITQRLRDIL